MTTSVKEAPRQKAILGAIRDAGKPLSPQDLADATGLNKGNVQSALTLMKEEGTIAQPGYGLYDLPENVEGEEEEPRKGPLEVAPVNDDAVQLDLFEGGGGPARDNGGAHITISRRQLRSSVGFAPSAQNAFAVRVVGQSMEPWIRDGQIVICQRLGKVEVAGRYVYWFGSDDGYAVKDMEPAGDGALRITQHGPNPRTEVFEPTGGKNTYRDEAGRVHTIDVKGRVIFPDDTARSMLTRITDELRKIVGR